MEKTPRGWKVLSPEGADPLLMTYEYSFGPGVASSLAVGVPGGIVIISPPCRVADGVLDDVAARGPVLGIVASNAYHYMGVPAWSARFPEAPVFAPAQSIARIQKKLSRTDIRPLAEATSVAGPGLELVDMPHYKTGEVLVRVKTGQGIVWYVTDVIFNLSVLPPNPIARFIFKASGSAPGLKFNTIASLFMMRDKRALKRWLLSEVEKAPPSRLIAAHGDVIDFTAGAAELKGLFIDA